MRPVQQAQVRDRRRKNWFSIDNEIIDEYGPKIGHHGIAVYIALCRYANEDKQQAKVGLTKLAERLKIGRAKLLSTLELLEEVGLVSIDPGDRATVSIYTLLQVQKGGSNENHVKDEGGSSQNQSGSNENQVGGSNQNCIKTTEYKTTNKTVKNNVTYLDEVTRQCTTLLLKTKGWTYGEAKTASLIQELREKHPGADAVKVCDEYEFSIRHGQKPKNYPNTLRTYFRKNEEWAGQRTSEEPKRRKKLVI